MWIYPTRRRILIPGGLRPIAPCPRPSLGRRAIISILRSGPRGLYCRGFCFSTDAVLIVGSTTELLVGCSRGQLARHLSGS